MVPGCDPSPSATTHEVLARLHAGEVAVDHLVTFAEVADHRLRHRGRRDRQHRTHRAQHGAAGDRRSECDRRMQIHRACRDARQQEVVLHLLVDDDEDQDHERLRRRVDELHQHRQRAGDVGADDRQELADQADPQRHCTGAWMPIAWNSTQWKNADNPASSARE